MTSPGLDALVSDGALLALETQAHLTDVFEHHPSWGVDLASGTFTFSGEGATSQTFGVQLLGSAAAGPRSWLWGWANPAGFPEPVLRAAVAARELGEKYQIPELTSGELPFPEDDAEGHDLAIRLWIATRVASGEWFGYRGEANPGQWVYMLLTGDGLSLPEPTVARTLRVATEALQLGLLSDPWRAFSSYATLRALDWDGTQLTLSDGVVTIGFDEQGRVRSMNGSAGPAGPTGESAGPAPSPAPAPSD